MAHTVSLWSTPIKVYFYSSTYNYETASITSFSSLFSRLHGTIPSPSFQSFLMSLNRGHMEWRPGSLWEKPKGESCRSILGPDTPTPSHLASFLFPKPEAFTRHFHFPLLFRRVDFEAVEQLTWVRPTEWKIWWTINTLECNLSSLHLWWEVVLQISSEELPHSNL